MSATIILHPCYKADAEIILSSLEVLSPRERCVWLAYLRSLVAIQSEQHIALGALASTALPALMAVGQTWQQVSDQAQDIARILGTIIT